MSSYPFSEFRKHLEWPWKGPSGDMANPGEGPEWVVVFHHFVPAVRVILDGVLWYPEVDGT